MAWSRAEISMEDGRQRTSRLSGGLFDNIQTLKSGALGLRLSRIIVPRSDDPPARWNWRVGTGSQHNTFPFGGGIQNSSLSGSPPLGRRLSVRLVGSR